jgi:PAS domain S-box-containing protein
MDAAPTPSDRTYRERAYAAFAGDRPLDDRIEAALAVGVERFDVEQGFVSRIDDDTQYITHSVGPHPDLQPGDSCSIEASYCKVTVEREDPLAVQQAADSTLVDDFAYDTFALETYLGCPVRVDGETYGTICFADRAARAEPFDEAELLFAELLARLLGTALERRRHDREIAATNRRLARERDRLQTTANNSFDLLFRLDPDGTVTFVSDAAERILGRPPDVITGRPFGALLAGAADGAADALLNLGAGDAVEGLRLELVDADGATVTVAINALPITDDGAVVAVQGVARDVSERAARERELRVKNRAMDDTDIGITISEMTPDGPRLRYANDGFRRLTGYGVDTIASEGWTVLSGDGSDLLDGQRVLDAVTAGESVSEELLSYREDGTPFWHRIRITPIEDDDGRLTHMAGFHEDITESKREAVLFGVLNRVLRHNLRNKMTVLHGQAQRIETVADEDRGALAADVVDMATQLTELSNRARELESYARSDRADEALDPAALLDRVVDEFTPETASVTVDVATDRSICAGPEIERALGELVENAAVHHDDPPAAVAIDVFDADGDVIVTIHDDGPGIPDNESAVFQQGRETALEHSGGLGLWLVNWIVTRYGGSFQIEPVADADHSADATPSTGADLDGGTVATVRLPGIGPEDSVAAVRRPSTPLFQ